MEYEEREAFARSKFVVSRNCGITSCGDQEQLCQNRQEMQLVSMECLDAQGKEYFEWIWKCSYTRLCLLHKLTDSDKERLIQFAARAEGKD